MGCCDDTLKIDGTKLRGPLVDGIEIPCRRCNRFWRWHYEWQAADEHGFQLDLSGWELHDPIREFHEKADAEQPARDALRERTKPL